MHPLSRKGGQLVGKLENLWNSDLHLDHRTFGLILLSNGLFFIASALYIYLAIIAWDYEKEVEDFPEEVLQADDTYTWNEWGYEDDYVFQNPITKTWVSEYAIIYFSAALGFVIAGVIDFFLWRSLFSVLMIMAASFGLASACYSDTNTTKAVNLNAVSVHLWLFGAFAVIFDQGPLGKFKIWMQIADASFVIATFMDVVFSWTYILNDPIRVGIPQSIGEIFVACLWLVTATIYLIATIVLRGEFTVQRSSNQVNTVMDVHTESGSEKGGCDSSIHLTVVMETEDDVENFEIRDTKDYSSSVSCS
jgi:hypothetical protein